MNIHTVISLCCFLGNTLITLTTASSLLTQQSLLASYHGYPLSSDSRADQEYHYPPNSQEAGLSEALYSPASGYSGHRAVDSYSQNSVYSYADTEPQYSDEEQAVLNSLSSMLSRDQSINAKVGALSQAMSYFPYHQQQHLPIMYGHMNPYGFHMDSKPKSKKKSYKKKKKHKYHDDHDDKYHDDHDDEYHDDHDDYHHMDEYHDDHHHDDDYHEDDDHYHKHEYKPKKKKKKKKTKKVYVPIVIKKKKKKKRKTIAVYKGFYIPGGSQIFGKFKKKKDCQKACEITPTCFAADYNPWLKKCYIHTNLTACEEMRTHPKLIHFKKIPCDLVETPRSLITLGTKINGGLEQKGIKNLQDCIKKCASAGQGIAPTNSEEDLARQICFGIDYDFATHKCYFHTDSELCPDVEIIPTPASLVEMPSVINILLCPFMIAA